MTTADIIAIEQLVAHYNMAIDHRDGDEYAATFTADGELVRPDATIPGPRSGTHWCWLVEEASVRRVCLARRALSGQSARVSLGGDPIPPLAIGAVAGGPGSDRRWTAAVMALGRRVIEMRADVSSPLA